MMNLESISTCDAPKAVGPYSQGIRAGDLIFLSGQIPLNPVDGNLISGGVREQTTQILNNLKFVLSAANSNLGHVVKTTVFMTDLTQFSVMNEVYETFFHPPFPARSTIQVSALPKGAQVEIEAVALLPESIS